MWKPANALHSITCPDHLPRSFARLIWATAQRPAVDTRIATARHFARAVSSRNARGCLSGRRHPLFLIQFAGKLPLFQCRIEFRSANRVSVRFTNEAERRPRRQKATTDARRLQAARQYGTIKAVLRRKLSSADRRLPLFSSFKRSCVRWTHTRFVMPIRHRSADTAARPDLPSFTARLR